MTGTGLAANSVPDTGLAANPVPREGKLLILLSPLISPFLERFCVASNNVI